jgi:hypothetical protein
MAVLCGVSQSAISRAESLGLLPDSIAGWCRHYGWSESKIRNECAKVARALKRTKCIWSEMELWRFFVDTPLEIESVRCAGSSVRDDSGAGRLEGKLATIYTDAPIIGQAEQEARRAIS